MTGSRNGGRAQALRAAAGRWWQARGRARQRARERNQSLLQVHDLASMPDGELDAYIERIKPPNGRMMLPGLAIAAAPAADIGNGRTGPQLLGYAVLALFCWLYAATVAAAFRKTAEGTRRARLGLLGLAAITYPATIVFGHNWIVLFIMTALACGTVLRGRLLMRTMAVLAASDGVIAGHHSGNVWNSTTTAYGTLLSGLITAAILSLHDVIIQLRSTRQELARTAVSQERLRFSRDLHDLLGHTMSVVVVKAEAVRRLASRDLDAALGQAADIESVARQALTEIREAVSGYREGSLPTELDRARSALDASGIDLVVNQSGPPLPPRTEALMGWVVREGVTNVVRHSGASSCRIDLRTAGGRTRLEITDNGDGSGAGGGSGTGLKGLTERLAMAGGSLSSGPVPKSGFHLTAELPEQSPTDAGEVLA